MRVYFVSFLAFVNEEKNVYLSNYLSFKVLVILFGIACCVILTVDPYLIFYLFGLVKKSNIPYFLVTNAETLTYIKTPP